MDQRGSLVDTNLKIYPSQKLIDFIKTIPETEDIPINILKYIRNDAEITKKETKEKINTTVIQFTNKDMDNINRIKEAVDNNVDEDANKESSENKESNDEEIHDNNRSDYSTDKENESIEEINSEEESNKLFLTTSDIDWMYLHISGRKKDGEDNIPYLHELFQGSDIVVPENRVIKRNPVLEARCVKLRAQQEAREYRKMTKGVDNVRMRFPEDSISYQLKQINRQLIAIGQFIISIFAGFLFGFRGIEWMVGNLDFGVRLLLGVMCALIIALAEIYFLAKKLNEELTMTETIQLGGPPKFANQPDYGIYKSTVSVTDNKEHQD